MAEMSLLWKECRCLHAICHNSVDTSMSLPMCLSAVKVECVEASFCQMQSHNYQEFIILVESLSTYVMNSCNYVSYFSG